MTSATWSCRDLIMESASAANAEPGGVVALGGLAVGDPRDGVLQMHGAGLGVGLVPGDRLQTLRADHRTRLVGAIHQIVAEIVLDVDDPHDVVLGRALRFHRDLRLHLLMAELRLRAPGGRR